MTWPDIKYFKSVEFDSPDVPGSGGRMKLSFVRKLDSLRANCGFPIVIDSGFRTLARNKAVGGEAASAHLTGEAADLRALTSRTRFLILRTAIMLDFNRIGIGDTFIHLDDSESLDPQVVWLYPPGTKKRGK